MRTVHVITGLGTGGAERMLVNLCLARQRSNVSQLVVGLMPGGPQRERLEASGVRVEDLGMQRGVPSLRALWRLARLFRQESPSVVQAWMYHADLCALLALWLSGRRRGTRLYWGVRCSDVDLRAYWLPLRIVVRLCAVLSRFADGIVANSEAGVVAHRRLGYWTRSMTVIDNGFDTDAFRPDAAAGAEIRRELSIPADAFVIGAIARVDVMKDYPTLLSALMALDGTTCVVAGLGTEALEDAPGLIKLGERADVGRLLNAFDVLVSASAFGEGFSNAIGEAMATGVPVVATDVGDARRIVGDCGAIVPPGDADALARAIDALRTDAETRREMAAAARERILAQFTIDRSIAAFDDLHRNGLRAGPEA